MRPNIRNRILGTPTVDEKVTDLTVDEDEDDEEDVDADGEEVAESSTSVSGNTPSMSQAAGGVTEDDLDDGAAGIRVQGGDSVGIDPAKLADLEERPSSLEEQTAANFLFPTTNPIGRGQMEIGYAKVSGTGVVEIPFDSSFVNQPTLVQTRFGFLEFSYPGGISWSYDLDIEFWDNDYDLDFDISVDWNNIRVPSLSFLWEVNSGNFKVFNAWGETWITYIATER